MAINYPQRWLREAKAIISKEGWRKEITYELLKCQKGLEDGDDNEELLIVKKYLNGVIIGSSFDNYYRSQIIDNSSNFKYQIYPDLNESFEEAPDQDKIIVFNYYTNNLNVSITNDTFISGSDSTDNEYYIQGDNLIDDKYIVGLNIKLKGISEDNINVVFYTTPELVIIDTYSSTMYPPTDKLLTTDSFGVYCNIYDTSYIPSSVQLIIEYLNPSDGGTIAITKEPQPNDLNAILRINRYNVLNDNAYYYYIIDGIQSERKRLSINFD